MLKYLADFKRLDFENVKTLKFFTQEDFDEFRVSPSAVHKRMIINAVSKLQSPQSKLGLFSDSANKQNKLQPKKLSYVAEDSFEQDKESEDDQEEFLYQSPAELLLKELQVG